MKALLAVLLISVISSASLAESSFITYNCDLAEGATARHGAQAIHLTFAGDDITSRVTIGFFKRNSADMYEVMGEVLAVYAHSANIHEGRYAGFKKFTPSEKFPPTSYFYEKFAKIALKENANRTLAVLAFPESKNAVYHCR